MSTVIDGTSIAGEVRAEIASRVAEMTQAGGRQPSLAVVLVGDRKDSKAYVGMKKKACIEVGITSIDRSFPESVKEDILVAAVQELNADPQVDGILVQLPLPEHVDTARVLDCIDLEKDVDGFSPTNIGMLAMRGRTPLYTPCTPKGCMELLARSGVSVAGKHAVVLGRSNIVGLPLGLLLLKADATVTYVHSRTPNLVDFVRTADIVIAAIGQAEMVKPDWLKSSAVIVDVGINAIEDATEKRGYRLVGDLDNSDPEQFGDGITLTPVPGGVGPMTIAMLLQNTLDAAVRRREA